MSNREQKRRVLQQLHDMGFQDDEISISIRENGYNLERCTDFLVSRQQNARPRLYVGMEVWIYSVDNEDWVPGNIVSITKQLVSIIFSGHDFRWLEKESDLFRIQDDKPEPLLNSNRMGMINNNSSTNVNHQMNNNINDSRNNLHNNNEYNNNNMINNNGVNGHNSNTNLHNNGQMEHSYEPPRNDEIDYHVRFTESVLGLELYSDEDGFNCIVGRCVSNIARANVTPGSQIVQVNDRWLANFRFEEIRDAVKKAAKNPPLNVTFRIKKTILTQMNKQPNGHNPNINVNAPHQMAIPQPNGHNVNVPSYSNTSPDEQIPQSQDPQYLRINEKKIVQLPSDDARSGHSISQAEEKQFRPMQSMNQHSYEPDDDTFEGHMTLEQAQRLQVGDQVDNRDDVGRFLLASIVEKRGSKLKIHYEGWNSKWDKWYDIANDLRKFARPRSISRKPNTRFPQLKIRDYVDINPKERHPGWRPGQIRRMDKYSGQAQIVYKEDGQEFLYWAHLNNPEEIAPFMTKSAETIQKQKPVEEEKTYQPVNNINNDIPNIMNQNGGSGSINQNMFSPAMSGSSPANQQQSHKPSLSMSQNSSSRARRPLPPSLQGKHLPPKPPRKSQT